jgi:hypothetical protein
MLRNYVLDNGPHPASSLLKIPDQVRDMSRIGVRLVRKWD